MVSGSQEEGTPGSGPSQVPLHRRAQISLRPAEPNAARFRSSPRPASFLSHCSEGRRLVH
jgi:hypothetical protein